VGHLFMFLVGGKTPDQSVHLNLTTTLIGFRLAVERHKLFGAVRPTSIQLGGKSGGLMVHLGAVCCPGEKEKVKTPEKMPHSLAFVDSTSELAQLA
ncbi:hypothetical protein LNV94_28885, partial [Klebsiella pneumoniae]|nr:hypothetical protein [Klebsiella pneumoniae]